MLAAIVALLEPFLRGIYFIFLSVSASRARAPVFPFCFAAASSLARGMGSPFLAPSVWRNAPGLEMAPEIQFFLATGSGRRGWCWLRSRFGDRFRIGWSGLFSHGSSPRRLLRPSAGPRQMDSDSRSWPAGG